MSDNQADQYSGQDADNSLNDSDVECSQSVCSDTHSDNTTVSEMTDKSTISLSTIHATLSNDETEQPQSPSTCMSNFSRNL